jgi:hypothetical protein
LDTIEIMCNDILRNYSKKEYQLMTAAFGTRPKRRLNRVLDALNFDYPDYEQLGGDAEGPKRKRIASALDKESTKLAKKEKEISEKLSPEPKVAVPRKRKAASPKPAREEEAPATPSAAEVEEILKGMTEPLPVKLSPLAPELTKFFRRTKKLRQQKVPQSRKNEELSKWQMSFIRHRHRHRRQKLSLPKPQPSEPKPPEPKPGEPKPPEPKLPEQALKPKPPEPKPGPTKILTWKPRLMILTIYF